MSDHVSDSLSPYLDDELSASERAAVDAHLRACPSCAAELEALRRLVAYAGVVATQDAPPARDLWPGIRARVDTAPSALGRRPSTSGIDATASQSDAASPHDASADIASAGRTERVAGLADAAARRHAPRRVSLSIAQLAAAAALLMAVSGTAAWLLRGRAPVTAPAPVIQAEIEPSAAAADIRRVDFADAQYDAAVADLERALQERRNDLNPRTVEILERNLKLIDAAIAQARQALEDDPGNTYLSRHLVESRRRKLDLLRRATAYTEGD